ncbi:hypothetical protein [Actibacterium sp. 188UL27-1]|uniref:hypothetical protein n=1 Tax=Actibacterium sp. 188UL27-1 TaxID=2786961 RepID=UPI00195D3D8E|nr:hypothetical protein [Actibacterium sp. 188UL27-1]MBM7066506.1 hypothetical protein [Actibacterium sp. 188UL27-1]
MAGWSDIIQPIVTSAVADKALEAAMLFRITRPGNLICVVSALAIIATPFGASAGRIWSASAATQYLHNGPEIQFVVGCDDDDQDNAPSSGPDVSPGQGQGAEEEPDFQGDESLVLIHSPEKLYLANCPDDETATDRQLGAKQVQKILRILDDNEEHCKSVADEYVIDCLANNYARAARQLSKRGEAGEVREAFKRASRRLKSIVRQTADTTQPQSRVPVRTPQGVKRATKRLTPVKPELKAAAFAAATKVVQELETVLLTSAENSERRQTYFAEVAQAVTGDKVLLRS